MRMPNKSVLHMLYDNRSFFSFQHFDINPCVHTSRYSYTLYRDVMFPRHDVIQRVSLHDPSIVDQISFDRPSCYD